MLSRAIIVCISATTILLPVARIARADTFISKQGEWSVAYLEVGNLNGCRARRPFPDQTTFQPVQLQSGTEKAWVIFISNPRWNAWLGKRKEIRLSLVTDWPTPKPWPFTFAISADSKVLSTTDVSVEFMNSMADASKSYRRILVTEGIRRRRFELAI
jgi:hypothetical protein